MNNSEDIIVSVCMITYNHEQYIAEAIHGVLMQETNFKVELILADDCSPDNSQKVIQEILDTYKGEVIIRYTRHTENKGMMPNFIWALNQCKGKYIALCEGDDYWTDPLKLQKQVGFLEENENCIICFHEVNVLEKSGEIVEDYIAKPAYLKTGKVELKFKDLLKYGNCMHTPSVMYRNPNDITPYFSFKDSPIGDYPLYLFLLSDGGYAQKLREIMSVYRNNVGVFSSSTILEKRFNSLILLNLIGSSELTLKDEGNTLINKHIKQGLFLLKDEVHKVEFRNFNNSKYLSRKLSFKILLKTIILKLFYYLK